ncbi:hypothetical protein THOG05_190038 [Vibrio rotiferianus]|nr:hypothetical protein THOG05_190038 [Vibrio rotiferianus]
MSVWTFLFSLDIFKNVQDYPPFRINLIPSEEQRKRKLMNEDYSS